MCGMADDLYERYKEALRTGHVAVLRGALDEAVAAYRGASEIAPSRALPHTSLGGVYMHLGSLEEALAEFNVAVALSPHDEGALLGQAEAMTATGACAAAAAALDHVADIQEASGRIPEAADTLRRAIELDESAERIRRQRALSRELRFAGGDHESEQLLARALRLREETPAQPSVASEPVEVLGERTPPLPDLEPVGIEVAAEPVEVMGEGTPPPDLEPASAVRVAPVAESEPEPEAGRSAAGAGVMDGVEEVAPGGATAPGGESAHQPTGDELLVAAEAAEQAGDPGTLRSLLVWTARAYAREGRYEAALDATHRLLLRNPGDVDAHLVLVELYVARSWDSLAAEKLKLLDRLADLNGDEETHQRICAAASRAFPNDASLESICA